LNLRIHNTSAERIQRNPLVKIPEVLLSIPEGNTAARGRDEWKRLYPDQCTARLGAIDAPFSVFVAPGQPLPRHARREIEGQAKLLANPFSPPSAIEFEFTASPTDLYSAAEGLPEDFRTSAIDWALELSQAVLIYVDATPGIPAGEPRLTVAPIQASFRCSTSQVDIWAEYLGRRIRPRHRFAIVSFAESEVQS
jgi:hypothetical protein